MSKESSATYTPQEIAKMLGVGERAVYAALGAGRIPSIRFGRRFVIPRAAFDRWLAAAGLTTLQMEYKA